MSQVRLQQVTAYAQTALPLLEFIIDTVTVHSPNDCKTVRTTASRPTTNEPPGHRAGVGQPLKEQ